MTARTPYGVVPAGTRLILASENLLDTWGTRTERGERITVEWGEPSPQGWYEPTFTVHSEAACDPTTVRALVAVARAATQLDDRFFGEGEDWGTLPGEVDDLHDALEALEALP